MANRSLCKIDGCAKTAKTRGWCNAHYKTWCKYGDAAAYRDPPWDPSISEVRERRAFSKEDVLRLLEYDPSSGIFRWRVRTSIRIRIGQEAGAIRGGYRSFSLFGKNYRAHHIAWLIMTGEWPSPDIDIDHINRDRSDNRWVNLRTATRSQNNMNGSIRSDNKSGARGVSMDSRGRWDSRIKVKGDVILLGQFDDITDAIAARKRAEEHYFGKFRPQGGG